MRSPVTPQYGPQIVKPRDRWAPAPGFVHARSTWNFVVATEIERILPISPAQAFGLAHA